METEAYKPTASLFTPELPSAGEIAVLIVCVVGLILIGKLLKLRWDRNNETVPIPVALAMGLGMLTVFFVVVTFFYQSNTEPFQDGTYILQNGKQLATYAPDGNYLGILASCMLAFALPLFYYGLIIVNSFATRVIDRVSPFGMQIHEPSEFAEARKLALRGDVDGAVKRYRSYLENTDVALFEAARLLKSEDRFPEAAALFLEISERYYGKKLIWAEAVYHLAKLRESNLHQTKEAMSLLDQIVERTPESRFGKLAQTELIRMNLIYGPMGRGAEAVDVQAVEDPFFDENDARVVAEAEANPSAADNGKHVEPGRRRRRHEEDTDDDIPPADPFFTAAKLSRDEDALAEASASAEKDAAVKSSATSTPTTQATSDKNSSAEEDT